MGCEYFYSITKKVLIKARVNTHQSTKKVLIKARVNTHQYQDLSYIFCLKPQIPN